MAKITKAEKEAFFESKYSFYWKFSFYTILIASCFSFLYVVTDFMAEGGLRAIYFLPRCAIILPLIPYIFIIKKIKSYKIQSLASIIMIHCIMWCTIWALSYRAEIPYANEGFMIMHVEFFALGLSAPFLYYCIGHSCFILNILISSLFLDYGDHLPLMLFLSIPCIGGISIINFCLEKAYIKNYHNQEKINSMLEKDALTHVYNRNKLIDICKPGAKQLIDDTVTQAGIMMIDIDKFKSVNDTFGHDVGDKILTFVASTVQGSIRDSDYLIRWGGEEFVVILPRENAETAATIAERIRQKVESSDNGYTKITVSLGVSLYTGVDINEDIKHADKAMYTAKQTGRSKVCVYDDSMEAIIMK